MTSKESDQIIDTLRLSEEQWQELAAKIDQTNPYETGQRRHVRVAYRKLSQIAVAIQQPDKKWIKYAVRSRDISSGGIGFIHGSFVHLGSACRVCLKISSDQVVCLEGVVRRCNLVQGMAHNIGVQFHEEINLTQFVAGDSSEDAESKREAG